MSVKSTSADASLMTSLSFYLGAPSLGTYYLTLSISPITEAYRAAANFASMPIFTNHTVTRAEYAESGSNASRRKFHDRKPHESEREKPKDTAKARGKQRDDDRSQTSSRLTRTRSKTTNGTTTRRR